MKHKTMLLALVVVSGLLYALPSAASAAGWDIDPAGGGETISFTVAGAESKSTSSIGTISCSSVTGTGTYTTKTTGTIQLLYHGCHDPFGFPLSSTGQPSGTTTSTTLVFHNIMCESTTQTAGGTPCILITGNVNHFATYSGVFGTVVVSGNGIIGDISSPGCGGTSTTSTVKFESVSTGNQKWKQEETAGTTYDLTSSLNGGTPVTASQDGEGTVTFPENATMTCP